MIKIDGWAMSVWKGTTESVVSRLMATRSHSLSISAEMVECSEGGRPRDYLPGEVEWSAKASGLLDSQGWLPTVGDAFSACLQIGVDYYVGNVVVRSVERSGPLNTKSEYTLQMTGNGGLQAVELDNDGFAYYFGTNL